MRAGSTIFEQPRAGSSRGEAGNVWNFVETQESVPDAAGILPRAGLRLRYCQTNCGWSNTPA